MRVSFNKSNPATAAATPPPVGDTATASSAVATTAPAENLAVGNVMHTQQLEGEFTARDMAVPRLNIGQKSGTMCDDNPEWIGQFIYDKGIALGNSINIVVSKLRKYYAEDLEFDSPTKPQIFQTHAEAVAAGVMVKDVCDIDLLIECNEEMEQFGMVDAGGKSYAPARWTVQSSAYGRTVGILLRDLAGWLKGDIASGVYTLTTEKRSNDKNTWYVPTLKTKEKTPEALRGEIKEKFKV